MAAQLVTTIKRYIGTAAEIAAMTLTGIPTGSTFFESDTGILKVLNAAGALVTAPSESVQLSGSNVEQANGADIALKSALVAGKTSAGKGVPIQVDADGKLQVGGITVESLMATTVGIDQTTPGTTNKVVAELSGSKMDLRGTAATKPLATAENIGATYWSVDTDPQGYAIEISDGTDWVVI